LVPALDRVVAAAASAAVAVDRDAAFPTATVDAAREAGLLRLISAADVGGLGLGIGAACHVVEAIARVCPTSAMVMCMHYAGAAVVEKAGSDHVRREIAAGRHLSTLAFSEAGSRSHFWAPTSTASPAEGGASLDARKSWITSANYADAYVWSSRPLAAEGMATLWLVPRGAPGLEVLGSYDGLGLRGNDSSPCAASGVVVPASAMLGADGGGFDMMMGVVLPIFALMNAGCSVGIMEGAVNAAAGHVAATRYAHLGSSLADLPTIRAYLARAKIRADQCRTLWADAITAVESGRADGMLRVLEAKAAAGEGALEVTATCMRVCGGAAYRKEVGVERLFRDAQAASVMAPTTDQLYDFIGKALTGLPLFG